MLGLGWLPDREWCNLHWAIRPRHNPPQRINPGDNTTRIMDGPSLHVMMNIIVGLFDYYYYEIPKDLLDVI
jgi:hypothetical protein